MSDLVHKVSTALKDLIEVRETNLGIEATVPVSYPGGELVDVIVERNTKDFSVHDSGFGIMHVTSSGLPLTRSLIERCKEFATRFDCTFDNSRVTKIATEETLGIAVALVANASRAIADLALESRRHSEYEFRREVVSRVREFAGDRVRENQEFKGASGRSYRVPVLVLDRSQAHPRHFVGALATRSVVLSHVAEFLDLHDAYSEVQNEALYDDAADFRKEDYALLKRVSIPIPMSQSQSRLQGIFE